MGSVNHKLIGSVYLLLALGGLSLGAIYSLFIRLELGFPSMSMFMVWEAYNHAVTVHGIVRIFGFVRPVLFSAYVNMFLPLYLGTAEVAYCRLNNVSLIIYVVALFYLVMVIMCENVVGVGWTFYPPLSTVNSFLMAHSVVLMLLSLVVMGFSTTFSAINFMATVLIRTVGLLRSEMGPFVATANATSLLLFLVLPALTVALLMLIGDTTMNTSYFDYTYGGDIILYRHLFWFFGHPEVYILILPAFGVVSMALSMYTGSEVIGEAVRIAGVYAIAFVGLLVWSHHMYTVGLELDTIVYFSVRTMVIAIPTGAKIYNYMRTINLNATPITLNSNASVLLRIVAFVVLFVLGGVTGVVRANGNLDIVLHDTMYVVAHFHFVLSLGSSIGVAIGAFYMVYLTHHSYVNLVNTQYFTYVCVLLVISMIVTFTCMHYLGWNVVPRRYLDYADYNSYWASISTTSVIMFFITIP